MRIHKDGDLPQYRNDIIFVTGSNKQGYHGAGAARAAYTLFGATYGVYRGLDNRTYHIPTKGYHLKEILPLSEIVTYIREFVLFTYQRPDLFFFITRVGCGFAGYKDSEIAPLFRGLNENVSIPEQWVKYIVH